MGEWVAPSYKAAVPRLDLRARKAGGAGAMSRRDSRRVKVETMPLPGGAHGEGLHWFRIDFPEGEGRCFITTSEAQHLQQLTTDWVSQALGNLAAVRGSEAREPGPVESGPDAASI